jgi:hypothetical protein
MKGGVFKLGHYRMASPHGPSKAPPDEPKQIAKGRQIETIVGSGGSGDTVDLHAEGKGVEVGSFSATTGLGRSSATLPSCSSILLSDDPRQPSRRS